jgi:hypothetical protein
MKVQQVQMDAKAAQNDMELRVAQLEAEKKLLQRQVQLDVKELELAMREAQLQQEEAVKLEREKLHEEHMRLVLDGHEQRVGAAVEKAGRRHEEKVRGMVSGVKEQAAGAKAAGGQLSGLVQAVQKLAEGQQAALETVVEGQKQTAQQLEALLRARSAPVMIERDKTTGRASRFVPVTEQ